MKEQWEKLQKGDDSVREKLILQQTKMVIDLAHTHENKGVFMDDLIQEGNLEVVMAVNDLLGNGEISNPEAYVKERVIQRLIAYVDEESDAKGFQNTMLAKVNLVYEATNVLAEDYGRLATYEELADFTNLSVEEIKDIQAFSNQKISVGTGDIR